MAGLPQRDLWALAWYLSGDEARFLTIALDNVRDVAERMGQGTLDL